MELTAAISAAVVLAMAVVVAVLLRCVASEAERQSDLEPAVENP
jgi:hypothetical protein